MKLIRLKHDRLPWSVEISFNESVQCYCEKSEMRVKYKEERGKETRQGNNTTHERRSRAKTPCDLSQKPRKLFFIIIF